MQRLWYWLKGTVRPISFLGAPIILLANILNGVNNPIEIYWQCLFGVSFLCLAMLYNNFLDRRVDRLNPTKINLAKTDQKVVVWLTLVLIPFVGLLGKLANQPLYVPILVLMIYVYSQVFAKIPVVKRLVVAGCVSSLVLLQPTQCYNLGVWVFGGMLFIFILWREWRKDLEDWWFDIQYKFISLSDLKDLYWWFLVAPLLGSSIVILTSYINKGKVDQSSIWLAVGIAIEIWSYIRVRAKHGDYPKKLTNRYYDGIIGLLFANLVILHLQINLGVVLFLFNSGLILYRATFHRQTKTHQLAILMDAFLWGSLFLIGANGINPKTLTLLVSVTTFVYIRENLRLVIIPKYNISTTNQN